MNNKTIKIFAVILALASVFGVLTACSGGDDGSLLFKKRGKLYYRLSEDDIAYELVTDDDGVTVVDEKGNLIWKITGADGGDATQAVSFPAHLTQGKVVSCQEFSITMPKGWTVEGNFVLRLVNEDAEAQIDYSFFENSSATPDNTAEARAQSWYELFKPAIDEGEATFEKEEAQVAGRDAIKVTVKTTSDNGKTYLESYFVENGNGVLVFNCTCPAKNGGNFDFKAVLDSIEYRI